MTTKNDEVIINEDEIVEDVVLTQEDFDALKAERDRAIAQATRYHKSKTKAEQVAADLKAKITNDPDHSEDYKVLWQKEATEKTKLLEAVKTSAVKGSVVARLTKTGVLPDAVDAVAKLIDGSIIQWDIDGGVDEVSVEAAVAKAKSTYPFLFEKKVSTNNPKIPANGTTSNTKEITRDVYNKMSAIDRFAAMQKGIKVID